LGTVLARPQEKQFTLRRASSCTRRCSVRVAPIAENSSLLPPVGVWAVLNPSVADRPLRPATDRRLGELLPHQLANRAWTHPLALLPQLCSLLSLCGIVGDFSPIFLTLGQVIHVLLTRLPLPLLPESVRLACVRHAASVYPEPGSNSPYTLCSDHTHLEYALDMSSDPDQTERLVVLHELTETAFANSYCSVFHSSIVKEQ
jgi:hypothetical protein